MYGNSGDPKSFCVMMLYITTMISALATGLTIEYTANKNGSVQFDSICQPSQVARRSDLIADFRFWISEF